MRLIAIQYWHPKEHVSFLENGGTRLKHCVEGSDGARFHPRLKMPVGSLVVRAGTDAGIAATSAFSASTLNTALERYGVERLFICGVPAEHTVLETALDSKVHEYNTIVVEDGIAPLSSSRSEVESAAEKMKSAGVLFVKKADLN